MQNSLIRISLVIVVLMFGAFSSEAQKKQKDSKAQAAFDAGEYHKAIDLFKEAYNKVDRNQKTAIYFKIGECYRILGDARTRAPEIR